MIDLVELRAAWPMSRMLHHLGIDPGQSRTARCPLCYHLQKTPAPTLRYIDQGWICYRCGSKGTPIDLFMAVENLAFLQAIEILGTNCHRIGPRYTKPNPPHNSIPFGPDFVRREHTTYTAILELIARQRDSEIALARTAVAEGDAPPEDLPAEIAFADMNAFQHLQNAYLDNQEILFHASRIRRAREQEPIQCSNPSS